MTCRDSERVHTVCKLTAKFFYHINFNTYRSPFAPFAFATNACVPLVIASLTVIPLLLKLGDELT